MNYQCNLNQLKMTTQKYMALRQGAYHIMDYLICPDINQSNLIIAASLPTHISRNPNANTLHKKNKANRQNYTKFKDPQSHSTSGSCRQSTQHQILSARLLFLIIENFLQNSKSTPTEKKNRAMLQIISGVILSTFISVCSISECCLQHHMRCPYMI